MMNEQEKQKTKTPRIVLMGEFSAGKSTLCNILMRARALPEKVTATRLAPVWMTKGPGQHMRVCLDGSEEPISLEGLSDIPVEDTLYIRLCFEEEMLEHCDFIDCPGISDPNMDPEVWGRVLVEADAVIWLTHATQAWRQSEAAVWESVPEAVREKSILLLTRWDKLTNDTDRHRVKMRVKREAGHLFNKVFPISLIEALEASDDYEAWQASGAAAFMEHMAELIADLNSGRSMVAEKPARVVEDSVAEEAPLVEEPRRQISVRSIGPAAPAPEQDSKPRIIPRRVKPLGASRRQRPPAGLRA